MESTWQGLFVVRCTPSTRSSLSQLWPMHSSSLGMRNVSGKKWNWKLKTVKVVRAGRADWLVGWLVGCVTLPETNISHLNTWPSQRKTSLRTINIQGLLLLGRGHPFQNPPKMKIQGTVLKKDQEGEILVHFQFSFCSTFLSLLW